MRGDKWRRLLYLDGDMSIWLASKSAGDSGKFAIITGGQDGDKEVELVPISGVLCEYCIW